VPEDTLTMLCKQEVKARRLRSFGDDFREAREKHKDTFRALSEGCGFREKPEGYGFHRCGKIDKATAYACCIGYCPYMALRPRYRGE